MLFKYEINLKKKKSAHTYTKQNKTYIVFRMNALCADKNANNKRQLHIKFIFTTQRVLVNVKDLLDSTAGN